MPFIETIVLGCGPRDVDARSGWPPGGVVRAYNGAGVLRSRGAFFLNASDAWATTDHERPAPPGSRPPERGCTAPGTFASAQLVEPNFGVALVWEEEGARASTR